MIRIRKLFVVLIVLAVFVVHISLYLSRDEHALMLPDIPSLHRLTDRLDPPPMHVGYILELEQSVEPLTCESMV